MGVLSGRHTLKNCRTEFAPSRSAASKRSFGRPSKNPRSRRMPKGTSPAACGKITPRKLPYMPKVVATITYFVVSVKTPGIIISARKQLYRRFLKRKR